MFVSPGEYRVFLGGGHEVDEPGSLPHVSQGDVGLVDLAVRGGGVDGVHHHILLARVLIQLLLKNSTKSLKLKKLLSLLLQQPGVDVDGHLTD